jgi:hypothetical protein
MTATFSSTASSALPKATQIVSLRVVAETRQAVVVMGGGDIVVVSIDDEGSPVRLWFAPLCTQLIRLCRLRSREHLRLESLLLLGAPMTRS